MQDSSWYTFIFLSSEKNYAHFRADDFHTNISKY